MAMTKEGVCSGEGEEPIAGGITRSDAQDAVKTAQQRCCGGKSCGSDTTSKLADAVAQASVQGDGKPSKLASYNSYSRS